MRYLDASEHVHGALLTGCQVRQLEVNLMHLLQLILNLLQAHATQGHLCALQPRESVAADHEMRASLQRTVQREAQWDYTAESA